MTFILIVTGNVTRPHEALFQQTREIDPAGLMSALSRRRLDNIKPARGQCSVFVGYRLLLQHTTLFQRLLNHWPEPHLELNRLCWVKKTLIK